MLSAWTWRKYPEKGGQVNVMVAESVKGNSPKMPRVLCETQEEPQVTPLRFPAEGEHVSARGRQPKLL